MEAYHFKESSHHTACIVSGRQQGQQVPAVSGVHALYFRLCMVCLMPPGSPAVCHCIVRRICAELLAFALQPWYAKAGSTLPGPGDTTVQPDESAAELLRQNGRLQVGGPSSKAALNSEANGKLPLTYHMRL